MQSFKKIFSLMLCIALFTGSLLGTTWAANEDVQAESKIITYPKPDYTQTSSIFSLVSDNGTNIHVEKYLSYNYAHFSFSGTIKLTVTVNEDINNFVVSPISYNIPAEKNGKSLTFSITDTTDRPMYLMLQINELEKLIILADPLETFVPPSSGEGIYNITAAPYNADGSGTQNVTDVIQRAIDDANSAGGGIVYVPVGVYKIIFISLKSNVTLYLEGGAVLRGSVDRNDYDPKATPSHLVRADKTENIKVAGRGVLDTGAMTIYDRDNGGYKRSTLRANDSKNIDFQGVIAKDSAGWSVTTWTSQYVYMKNMKVLNIIDYKIENDGINIVSSSHALVEDWFIITNDDATCTKAARDGIHTNDITFRGGVSYTNCRGVKAGMQVCGPMYDIWFRDIDVIFARAGIGVENNETSFGKEIDLVENVHFIDVNVEKVANAFTNSLKPRPIEFQGGKGPKKNIFLTRCNIYTFGPEVSVIRGNSSIGTLDGVTMTGLIIEGKPITSVEDGKIEADKFTKNIVFRPDQKMPVYKIELVIGSPYMSVNAKKKEIDPGRLDTVPLIVGGRTMIPIRSLVEELDGTVNWNELESKITINTGNTQINMWIDKDEINVNGTSKNIDAAPTVINARTMVPLRFVLENLDYDVEWIDAQQKINITSKAWAVTPKEKRVNIPVTIDYSSKTNLVSADTFSASSENFDKERPVTRLFDGIATTKSLALASDSKEIWAEFSFAEAKTITDARIWEDNDGNQQIAKWKLEYFDGSSWKDVFDWTESNETGWNTVEFEEVKNVMKIRARFVGNEGKKAEIGQFECYGY